MTVDSRVDVRGVIGSPEIAIGPGNIGNLTADTKIGYPSSGGDYDTVRVDSARVVYAWAGADSGQFHVSFTRAGTGRGDYVDSLAAHRVVEVR